jgi:hypothetical protein
MLNVNFKAISIAALASLVINTAFALVESGSGTAGNVSAPSNAIKSESIVSGNLAQNNLTYWYHPSGAACPAYFFNPGVAGAAAAAARSCQNANGSCVSSQGTAGPAC